MSFLINDHQSLIRNFLSCPDLLIRVSSDWSSRSENYRQKIRSSLSHETGEDCHSLTGPPKLRGYHASIAHCPIAGGYVAQKRPAYKIGFDLEDRERLTRQLIERVSTPEEIAQAPAHETLWVAKEAAFKCLAADLGIKTIAELVIKDWTNPKGPLLGFSVRLLSASGKASGKALGRGMVFQDFRLIAGIFRSTSQT